MGTRTIATRAALALSLALALTGPAGAIPLFGDETRVEVTSAGDLEAAGIDLGLVNAASFDGRGDIVLPITGGDLTIPLLEGSVEHQNSGFSLGVAPSTPNISPILLFQNLEIDLLDLVVRAELTAGFPFASAGILPVFDARACLTSTGVDPCFDRDGSILLNGFGLDWTETVVGIVNDTLGTSLVSGDGFGVAHLDLRFVPEPASAALLGAGLLALARRRSR